MSVGKSTFRFVDSISLEATVVSLVLCALIAAALSIQSATVPFQALTAGTAAVALVLVVFAVAAIRRT